MGVHGNSGYLFSFHPQRAKGRRKVEIIARLTSLPSRRSGLFDQFTYGYLGFLIEGDTVFYLTGAPILRSDGERVRGKDKLRKVGKHCREHRGGVRMG